MQAAPRLAGPATVIAARIAASAVALAWGFRAVSDDDFARVAIAQAWAHAPRLDPTGTSWLPLPFWTTGSFFLLAGRSLDAARVAALLLAVVSSLLVYVAARWLAGDARGRRAAVIGGVIAALFPWSARLGVATVPELPCAALSLLALAAAASEDGRRRCIGAVALVAATLSRYDPWPLAAGFALLSLVDAARSRGRLRAQLAGAAAIAIAGPALWIAWNAVAHGDPLHFLARVALYKQALGGAGPVGLLSALAAYPLAAVENEPELLALAIAGAVIVGLADRRALAATLRPYARPAALSLLGVALLTAAAVNDAAPTHHPERALLVVLLLEAVVAGALWSRALEVPWPRRTALVVALAIGGAALLRYRVHGMQTFAPRAGEVAAGEAAAALVGPGEKVLVEVVDYGHWAFVAATGRPEAVVLDREIDPRAAPSRSSFEDEARLRARLVEAGATWFAARPSAVCAAVGAEVTPVGSGLALYALKAPSPGGEGAR